MQALSAVGLNERAARRAADLVAEADTYAVECHRHSSGAMLIDAGVECRGSIAAGLVIADICMSDLGRTALVGGSPDAASLYPTQLQVRTSQPVLACLASQYAGWSVNHPVGDKHYYAMLSGPGRALAKREALFDEPVFSPLQCATDRASAVFVLENDRLPPADFLAFLADACGVEPAALTLIVTPTASLAGGVQVVARIVEVALHKAHEIGFDVARIVDGAGWAPLPPAGGNMLTAMGRTNDAILYGGRVQLMVTGDDDSARTLAAALPSATSRDYGKPFADTFAEYDYDFYKIDASLFCPAAVWVTAIESGHTYQAGALNPALLAQSFGIADT